MIYIHYLVSTQQGIHYIGYYHLLLIATPAYIVHISDNRLPHTVHHLPPVRSQAGSPFFLHIFPPSQFSANQKKKYYKNHRKKISFIYIFVLFFFLFFFQQPITFAFFGALLAALPEWVVSYLQINVASKKLVFFP